MALTLSSNYRGTIHDSTQGVTVLFGGYVGNDRSNDRWEWAEQTRAMSPSRRRSNSIACAKGDSMVVSHYVED